MADGGGDSGDGGTGSGAVTTPETSHRDDRATVQARLDTLVRENRFTISVVFPVVGAVLLVASAEGAFAGTPLAPLAFNGGMILLGTLVMRSPLVVGLAPLVGRRELAGLGLLSAYAYA